MPQLIINKPMFSEWCFLSDCLTQDCNSPYRERSAQSLG